jgi:diguanylate cyclase (GGDEF)-like protein
MIDIDHFKRVNDQWGHPLGDAVLKTFAAACQSAMRDNDKVGRWGGEEFVVLLPETDRAEAEMAATRLRARIAALTIDTRGGGMIRVTVSIGTTTAHPGDTVETLLKRADDALYDAKAAGRDRVVCR